MSSSVHSGDYPGKSVDVITDYIIYSPASNNQTYLAIQKFINYNIVVYVKLLKCKEKSKLSILTKTCNFIINLPPNSSTSVSSSIFGV